MPRPPASETELLQRADALAGSHLGDIATAHALPVPPDLRSHKGWIGDLLEHALGAEAGNASEPDFPHLGIELKTIPVDDRGRPRQTTWVCVAPMGVLDPGTWWASAVRRRLSRVLFVPVLGQGPPAERRCGAPVLWSPDAEQEAVLKADWEALTELLAEGEVWQWHARHGVALQLRPKAASARNRRWVTDGEGEWVQTVPRGFYLRTSFTAGILAAEPRLLHP
ncbi:MAG: DNA mismatch repair endonuclease MutH [Myxococcota bacterium]|nr:DNA mismatch repair endonuclease MutH [Myxococcota bacterium]